jgi:hypothetical protein
MYVAKKKQFFCFKHLESEIKDDHQPIAVSKKKLKRNNWGMLKYLLQ